VVLVLGGASDASGQTPNNIDLRSMDWDLVCPMDYGGGVGRRHVCNGCSGMLVLQKVFFSCGKWVNHFFVPFVLLYDQKNMNPIGSTEIAFVDISLVEVAFPRMAFVNFEQSLQEGLKYREKREISGGHYRMVRTGLGFLRRHVE